MQIKKLLSFIFLILVVIVLFEVGFYIGVNYQKSSASLPPATLSDRQIAIPTIPIETILTGSNNEYKTATGASVPANPGINLNILGGLIGPLKSADKGLVKDASINYTFRGKVGKIEKNAKVLTKAGTEIPNIFFLSLENPSTGVIVNIYVESNEVLKEIKVWSKLDPANQVPISIDEIKVGDMIEDEEGADLVNGKMTSRNIYLIQKAGSRK